MGFVSSLIGGAGGANGTGFAAPSSASIATPTTGTQVSNAYGASQTALQQQQAFLQAVQAQNGLNNQTNVYNQLQGVANGTGPNPAQAQLAQATGANVANQAALMAGQRGAGANVGLIARQSAQQGAATQQQAAGQAASMQAQQSLNALSGMGNLATSQANQLAQATGANTGATQSEQQTLLNAIAQQNNAQVGMQSNINSANATLGAAQMTAQNNLLGNIMGSVGSAALLGGGASAASGGAGAAGAAGVGGAGLMAGGAGDAVVSGGALDAVGSGLADAAPLLALAAKGGEVKGYDSGGVVGDQSPLQQSIQPVQPSQPTGPQSQVGKTLASQNWNLGSGKPDSSQTQGTGQIGSTIGKLIGKGIYSMFGPSQQAQQDPYGMGNRIGETTNETAQDIAELPNSPSDQKPVYSSNDDGEVLAPEQTDMAKGGKVPAMVSPGERYLSPEESKMAAKGANPMKLGEKIPGKPKVGGAQNNYANDTVPKTLEEGGLVLPRSVTQAKNPAKEAHKFVAAIMAKNGKIAKR
jgi:hypothetical protein